MAAYSWTASNVKPDTGNRTSEEVFTVAAGVTVTAGQPCTLNDSNQIVLASNASSALSGSKNLYIAVTSGAAGGRIAVLPIGSRIEFGTSVFALSDPLVVLGGPGVLELYSDLSTSDWIVIMGYAISTTTWLFRPQVLGLQKG